MTWKVDLKTTLRDDLQSRLKKSTLTDDLVSTHPKAMLLGSLLCRYLNKKYETRDETGKHLFRNNYRNYEHTLYPKLLIDDYQMYELFISTHNLFIFKIKMCFHLPSLADVIVSVSAKKTTLEHMTGIHAYKVVCQIRLSKSTL